MDILESSFADIKKIELENKSLYLIRPKYLKAPYKTVIFYHGWSSSAKNQIFRANILASYGYQVVLPEALNHGERGLLDYTDMNVIKEKFFPTLMNNIKEAPELVDYVKKNLEIDDEHLYVAGHSMGAITAGALFTFNRSIKSALIFNGTLNWKWLVNLVNSLNSKEADYELARINEFMLNMDPMEHINDIKDRPIAMLNGELDNVISAKAEEEFYNKAKAEYSDENLIFFKKYENTYHQLTTQMMEDGIRFLKKIEEC